MNHWDFSATWPILLFGTILWVTTGWLCWQNWRRRGPTKGVGWLEALRFVIVTLLLFTLLKPEFVKLIILKETPSIVVLADASASMTTRDVQIGEKTIIKRSEWLQQARTNRFWKPWEKTAKVVVQDFSHGGGASTNANPALEDGTDIGSALDGVLRQEKNLKAVVMLSDGDWNLGESPIGAATRYQSRGIPIYTVAVGSETPLPDIVMEQVSAPAYGLLGEQVSIPFKIRNYLPREIKTTVSLKNSEGKEEVKKQVILPAFAEMQDTLVWLPRQLGEHDLTLSVPVAEGEYLEDNNEARFRISVRTEKLRVLVVDSLPRWEYRYLRNALERDPGVDMNCILFHPNGMPIGGGPNYLSAFPNSKEEISKYDVVFVGDIGIGEGELTPEQAALLRGLVEQQGSGLVFLPGSRGRELTLVKTVLGEMLPVIFDDAKSAGVGLTTESSLQLTTSGRGHFLTMLASDETRNEEVWRGLPGFYWSAGVLKSKAGAEVLAVHSALRNANGRIPLLVTRPFGNGETLFMGTDSAWRWRRGVEDKYHYRFWGQVVRWMAHKRHLAAGKGVRLAFSPENPRVGDNIFLNATVFDSNGLPLEKGVVTAKITAPSGRADREELNGVPGGWGVYKGGFTAQESGKYKVTITGDKAVQSLDAEIIVTRVLREKLGQPANTAVLREIADLTQGKSGGIRELDSIIQQISLLPEAKPLEQRIRLWSNPWWAGMLVMLLAIYWTGRKMAGLL